MDLSNLDKMGTAPLKRCADTTGKLISIMPLKGELTATIPGLRAQCKERDVLLMFESDIEDPN